jgi:hypothetical protein
VVSNSTQPPVTPPGTPEQAARAHVRAGEDLTGAPPRFEGAPDQWSRLAFRPKRGVSHKVMLGVVKFVEERMDTGAVANGGSRRPC